MSTATEFPLLFFLEVEGEGILAIVGSFGTVIAVALLIYLGRVKGREFMHKERMGLIERAQTLPENINQLLASFAPAPDQDLRVGLIWLIIGLGSSLVLYLLEDSRPHWPAGLIPVFIGLAYLVSFFVMSRRPPTESRLTIGVLTTAEPPAMAAPADPALLMDTTSEESSRSLLPDGTTEDQTRES